MNTIIMLLTGGLIIAMLYMYFTFLEWLMNRHFNTVHWNEEYETYEHVAEDGCIIVFRNNLEAKRYADTYGLKYVE